MTVFYLTFRAVSTGSTCTTTIQLGTDSFSWHLCSAWSSIGVTVRTFPYIYTICCAVRLRSFTSSIYVDRIHFHICGEIRKRREIDDRKTIANRATNHECANVVFQDLLGFRYAGYAHCKCIPLLLSWRPVPV